MQKLVTPVKAMPMMPNSGSAYSPIDKMFLIKKKHKHIQVISHLSLSLLLTLSQLSLEKKNKTKNKQILAIFCNSCKHACRSVPIYFSLTWQHIYFLGSFVFFIFPYFLYSTLFI